MESQEFSFCFFAQEKYQRIQQLQLDGKHDPTDYAQITQEVDGKKKWLEGRRPVLKSMMAGTTKLTKVPKADDKPSAKARGKKGGAHA